MKLAWLTDIHLECSPQPRIDHLCRQIVDNGADAVCITGDIAQAKLVPIYLEMLHKAIQKPIYFVLGNHDFWRSSFKEVAQQMKGLCRANKQLIHLNDPKLHVELAPNTYLIGNDGWYDGRYGDWWRSNVRLVDEELISELKHLPRQLHFELLNKKGDAAARDLRAKLKLVLEKGAKKIFYATHIPPYEQLCWYNGVQSDFNWTPHFSCKATGDVITEFATTNPDTHIHILCGHSHGGARYNHMPNVVGWCGEARYQFPQLQKLMTIE